MKKHKDTIIIYLITLMIMGTSLVISMSNALGLAVMFQAIVFLIMYTLSHILRFVGSKIEQTKKLSVWSYVMILNTITLIGSICGTIYV